MLELGRWSTVDPLLTAHVLGKTESQHALTIRERQFGVLTRAVSQEQRRSK